MASGEKKPDGRGSPTPSQQGPSQKVMWCKKAMKIVFSHLGLTALVVLYAVLGGYLFKLLESGNEINNCEVSAAKYNDMENKSQHNIWEISKSYAQSDLEDEETKTNLFVEFQSELQKFREDVFTLAYDGKNCSLLGVDPSAPADWSFGGSLLFAVTIMTTIGYGNISPQTNWGKIMVIAYAILGIPIMLLCLANIGDLMADMFKFVYVKVCCCGCFRRRKPDDSRPQTPDGDGQSPEQWQQNFNKQQQQDQDEYDSDEDEEPDYTEASVPLTITMGVIAFYILFGASVFSILEEWDMTESAYYCFITISTVGFGDFVPGSHGLATTNAQWEMVFTSIYMGLGLALLSMCFSLMQEEIAVKFKLLADKISLLARRNKPEHDDDSGSIVESLPPGHGKSD